MTIEYMRDLLSKDEKITVDTKPVSKVFRKMYMKQCVHFSNRYGGYIIMGAKR